MTNLLDERIAHRESMDRTREHKVTVFHGAIPRYRQYHCPIDSPEHLGCNNCVSDGVIVPSILSGFYLQFEIWDVLKWAKYRASATLI